MISTTTPITTCSAMGMSGFSGLMWSAEKQRQGKSPEVVIHKLRKSGNVFSHSSVRRMQDLVHTRHNCCGS